MHRLLQGDVGSGKTVVAVSALLMGVQGGYQGAFMAPTEVLAEQHDLGVRDLLRDLTVPSEGTLLPDRPLNVALLTNRTTAKERERLQAGLADGSVDILIGTHALLEERVEFKALGVVVIDEQHRFGVEQRAALRGKGDDPDVLVMTATPIPRTAAMTVYGDLDVTVLDELPPGRTPVETKWVRGELEESEAFRRVEEEVAAGRQAYVPAEQVADIAQTLIGLHACARRSDEAVDRALERPQVPREAPVRQPAPVGHDRHGALEHRRECLDQRPIQVRHGRALAERRKRRHALVADAAGHDAAEVIEVRRHIDRHAVEGDPVAHAHPDRRDLVLAARTARDPQPDPAFAPRYQLRHCAPPR